MKESLLEDTAELSGNWLGNVLRNTGRKPGSLSSLLEHAVQHVSCHHRHCYFSSTRIPIARLCARLPILQELKDSTAGISALSQIQQCTDAASVGTAKVVAPACALPSARPAFLSQQTRTQYLGIPSQAWRIIVSSSESEGRWGGFLLLAKIQCTSVSRASPGLFFWPIAITEFTHQNYCEPTLAVSRCIHEA